MQPFDATFLDSLHEGVQVISPEWRYLYVNETVAKQGRSTRDRLLGRTMMDCYPGVEETPIFAQLRECMERREPRSMLSEYRFPDDSVGWFDLRMEPVPQGVVILSVDVTESRRVE